MTKDKAAERLEDKKKHYNACKEAYRDMKAKSGVYCGHCEVKDTGKGLALDKDEDTSMQDVEEDIQDEAMLPEEKNELEDLPTLHKGSYLMGSTTLECMIYKVDSSDPKTFEMFRLLETVTHPAVVRHHAYYEEHLQKSLLPRIVLSGCDSTFGDLLRTDQASKRFFAATTNGTSLKKELIIMILDLCSGIEHLSKLGLYPPKLDLSDLYVCKDGPTKYRLQLLILTVEKLRRDSDRRGRMAQLWKEVKDIVEEIRNITNTTELNEVNERFVNYIGHDVSLLEQYPLSWSYQQKGSYLMSIISVVDQSGVRGKLQKSGLKWAGGKSPKLIDLLIANDKKRLSPYKYCSTDPFDYLYLCRTAYKHYPTLSREISEFKDMCPLREDFLKQMEKWEPLIWCIIYEAIGSISSLECSTSDKSKGSG